MDLAWVVQTPAAALAFKMLATAATVIAAALGAERAGPRLGGLITSLPVSAGPAYVLLALKSDDAFVAASGLGSYTTMAGAAAFLAFVILAGPRLGAIATVLWGFVAWSAAIAATLVLPRGAIVSSLINAAAFAGAFLATRRADAGIVAGRAARGHLDLLLRAVAIGLLVAVVVTVSDAIGPNATGVAALFPVTFLSVTWTLHRRLGGAATAAVMASALKAMIGFALALLVIHIAAEPLGRWWALLLSLATTLGWSAMLLFAPALRGVSRGRRKASSSPSR